MTFYRYPLARIEQTLRSVGISLRTLPPSQLEAERTELSRLCESSVGNTPAATLVKAYESELNRRQSQPPGPFS